MKRLVPAAAVAASLLTAGGRSDAADTAKMGASQSGPLIPGGAACNLGQYLAGLAVFASPQISNVQPLCGKMEPDGGWSGVPAMGSEVMAQGGGPAGRGEGRRDLFCPRDFWVWGYKGYTQTYGINAVTQLTLTCRNVKTGATTTVASPYVPGVSQLEWPASSCDQSSVSIGAYGTTHDSEVIQFGLACATTQPALRAQRMLSAPGKMGAAALFPTPAHKTLYRAGIAAGQPTAAVRASNARTFAPPLNRDGTRLHACQVVGGLPCGQAPADAFCKAQGYARALAFANGMEKVPAETLAGQRCATLECNVFSKIECVR